MARVGAGAAPGWGEPLAWSDLVEDPVAVLVTDVDGEDAALPPDVFHAGQSYSVGRFTLTKKAQKDFRALCDMLAMEPERFEVRFGREAVEHAVAVGAVAATKEGWQHLIVGQGIGDELACGYVAACLKTQRDFERRVQDEAPPSPDSDDAAAAGQPAPAAPSEDELKEQRRRERAEQDERRRAAYAHNTELGAAVLRHLARLKVDERVLKVLIAVDVASDLPGLAARGARYGFPGWPVESKTKAGKTKVAYPNKEEAGRKAADFLAGASGLAELAGRAFCLIAMTRYASEEAVASSNRSFSSLRVGAGAPWSGEVVDLIDELCAERLPEHLTAAVREERAARRAEQERSERERSEALRRLEGIEGRLGELSAQQREQAIADVERAYGAYSPEGFELRQRIREATEMASTAVDDETNSQDGAEAQPA